MRALFFAALMAVSFCASAEQPFAFVIYVCGEPRYISTPYYFGEAKDDKSIQFMKEHINKLIDAKYKVEAREATDYGAVCI